MSYKVTIIDNENGEVILNEDNAVAIIGAVANEKGTHVLSDLACAAPIALCALRGAEEAVKTTCDANPRLGLMHALLGLEESAKQNDD